MQNKLAEITPHIIKIREHLWSGQISGRSAVMVGAGFSFNAESLAVQGASMLSWNGLALKIYDALYPDQNEDMRRSAIAGDGTLKIAQEYETVFGRGALDELIVSSLPDASFKPGALHKQLLELPWSDVFTTNYDTLLERASAKTFERNYDPVMTPQDVARASRPRIVKLHGSFPSHKPFILTEEDFRTYPRKFAPFVNTVQQSMIENVFCLIGFSGDDPNFQFWSGWVRDNLGEAAPKIYLIGLHNYSKSKEQMLIDKGIIPLDLSPAIEASQNQSEGLRYKAALEWFFASLKYVEDVDVGNWPDIKKSEIQEEMQGEKLTASRQHYFHPSDLKEDIDSKKLEGLFKEWRAIRLTYPGWLIAPAKSRKALWFYTESFIPFVYSTIHNLPVENALLLLRELIWRTDLTLRPMMLDEANKAVSVLEKLNPFPAQLELGNAKPLDNVSWVGDSTSMEVASSWVEVAFAVVKEARDDLDDSRFQLWIRRLEKVCQLNHDWQARWYHEQCLYGLMKFATKNVHQHLSQWPETPTRPEWTARRAAVFAELDDWDEAEHLAESALAAVREGLKTSQNSLELLSQESWLLVHLNLLVIRKTYSDRDKDKKFNYKERLQGNKRRLKKLKAYDCDPQKEIDDLEYSLRSVMPRVRLKDSQTIRKPAFELGRVTTSHTFGGGPTLEDYLPAFSPFPLAERAGYPLRLSGIRTFEHLDEAARWIWPIAPFWGMSALIRYGKHDSISNNDWLSKARIASLPQDHISTLFKFALSASNQALENLPIEEGRRVYSSEILKDSFELLSKLSFRLSDAQISEAIKLALNAYRNPEVQEDTSLHDSLNRIFERCFLLLPPVEAVSVLLDCVDLPLPTADETKRDQQYTIQRWPEPILFLLNNKSISISTDAPPKNSTVFKLVELAGEDLETVRQRAVWRLFALLRAGLLSTEQQDKFALALWDDANLDQATGLPTKTGLYVSSLLEMPELKEGHAKSVVRRYLLENPLPSVYEKQGSDRVLDFSRVEPASYIDAWVRSAPIPLLTKHSERIRIAWESDEIVVFSNKVLAWWDAEKSDLDNRHFDYVRSQLQRVDEAFLRVVLSAPDFDRGKIAERLNRFIDESEERNYVPFSSSLLLLGDSDKTIVEKIAHKLLSGLSDRDYSTGSRAIDAIVFWQFYAYAAQLHMPPAALVDRLIEKILMLEDPALERSCFALSKLLREIPERLSEHNLSTIERALKRILEESKIPSFEEFDAEPIFGHKIPLNQRPNMQYAGTELAAALYTYNTKSNLESPQIVFEWQKVYKDTVFPEIRQINWE